MNYPKNIAYTKMDRFKLSKRTKQKNVIIVVLMYGVFYDGFCEKLSIFFWFPINISSSSLSADIFDQKWNRSGRFLCLILMMMIDSEQNNNNKNDYISCPMAAHLPYKHQQQPAAAWIETEKKIVRKIIMPIYNWLMAVYLRRSLTYSLSLFDLPRNKQANRDCVFLLFFFFGRKDASGLNFVFVLPKPKSMIILYENLNTRWWWWWWWLKMLMKKK